MIYVQFYDKKLDGTLGETCGTDGVFKLDARKNIVNLISDAQNRAKQLKNVRNYPAFKIMQGGRYSNPVALTELIEVTK